MTHIPTIAVLGAPGTGAHALADALRARLGHGVAAVVGSEDAAAMLLPPSGTTLTLLMGLDLPCPPAQQAAREAADARLRAALAGAGRPFRVVYGQGERRIALALDAIKYIATNSIQTSARGQFYAQNGPANASARQAGGWHCGDDACCDPGGEWRLFTALLKQRARTALPS